MPTSRTLFAALLTVLLAACVGQLNQEKEGSVDPTTMNDVRTDLGAADSGNDLYKGDAHWDTLYEGSLTVYEPLHYYTFEAEAGDEAGIDLASRDGDDMLVMLYEWAGDRWQYVTFNDDYYPETRNARIDFTFESSGEYLVLATTWEYAYFGRKQEASYHLQLHCLSGICGGASEPPEDQLCGSRGLGPCAEGTYCNWPDNQCGAADAPGVCEVTPDACPEIYSPICGCDGRLYGNDCEAAVHGIDVSEIGTCIVEQGQPCDTERGLVCDEGLRCNTLENRHCGMWGVCEIIPEPVFCTMEYAPQCGCDGHTYGNGCVRVSAGVALDHYGACEE